MDLQTLIQVFLFSLRFSTVYCVMGLPPSLSGTSHATTMKSLYVSVECKWRGEDGLSKMGIITRISKQVSLKVD